MHGIRSFAFLGGDFLKCGGDSTKTSRNNGAFSEEGKVISSCHFHFIPVLLSLANLSFRGTLQTSDYDTLSISSSLSDQIKTFLVYLLAQVPASTVRCLGSVPTSISEMVAIVLFGDFQSQ